MSVEAKIETAQVKAAVADLKDAMTDMDLDTLTKSLNEERRKTSWGTHPVDIRLSIPLGFKSFYIVLAAGGDGRSKERIAEDSKNHPLMRMGNILFVLSVGLLGVSAILLGR